LSKGAYVEGATDAGQERRQLAAEGEQVRVGFRCHHYEKDEPKFNAPYDWKHCEGMIVGETYEIHWPHSAAGACGTKWQYQEPFYDGVFCHDALITVAPLNTYKKIGVQAQIFTVINDESDESGQYDYPDLINGMIVGGDMGKDMAMYTGSTTGTSRSNLVCSRYTPITWQVDRTCHLISARSFDNLCKKMSMMADDMSKDMHAHGSRELVSDKMVADNMVSKKHTPNRK
jgi:hypothetical protein